MGMGTPMLIRMSIRMLTSMHTGTLMSINSSLKHRLSRGNEMCSLCTPAKNAAVAVPNFWADFCNPCKRLKHSVQHKKYFISRVEFYCYCLPPYGGRTEHEAKTASCSCETCFPFLIFGTQSFRSILGMSSPISGVGVVFCSFYQNWWLFGSGFS